MTDLNDTLKIIDISDKHLGHPSIPPLTMCLRYQDLIYPKLKEANLLIINGDLFDSALSLADTYINDILIYLSDLLDKCIENDVTILATRGTFSHDRDQVKVLETLARNKGMTDNFHYYDTITLTTILGRRFLILPDDLPYKNSDEILTVVHELMVEKSWTTVDYALTHGYFEHVVPAGVHLPKICYTYNQFSFVTRLISSGHVHTTSIYTPKGKTVPVLYTGSPERLRHGEEEAKGCYFIVDKRGEPLKIQFLKNEKTTTFKDYNKDLTVDDAILFWRKIFEKHKSEKISFFKFTHPDVGVRLAVEKLSKEYPNVIYTHRSPKDDNKKILDGTIVTNAVELSHVPTIETLPKDVLDFLKDHKKEDDLTEELIATYLEEL